MELLNRIQERDILFLDIETVPMRETYAELPDDFKTLWNKKSAYWQKDDETGEDHYEKAGIYAEFGKIVCISVGILVFRNGKRGLRLKSFAGDNEKQLLADFAQMCTQRFNGPRHHLCAHNGKEFDYPYIARRMLINGLKLPAILDLAGRKPWEVKHLDTLELWKFGDYKNFTSLSLLAASFGIPTPKDDIDGSQVASVYYQEKNLARIVEYCQKDVVALVQLFLRYKGEKLIGEEYIELADENAEY